MLYLILNVSQHFVRSAYLACQEQQVSSLPHGKQGNNAQRGKVTLLRSHSSWQTLDYNVALPYAVPAAACVDGLPHPGPEREYKGASVPGLSLCEARLH